MLRRCAEADRGRDAAAAVHAVARRLLDRDQPAGEHRRPQPPSYARQGSSPVSTRRSRCSSLKDIVESLEGAIDAFEKVANTVEQIAVKEG
ncbi:hypothetical protein [Nocardioides convexus]|uniref:hypothetical protein n=1 Tax=Nocardioides convexus TaxID=2712224 RepID=UPI0024187EA5|nr:hypothetical protein [Nocardioides convexus]